MTALHEVAMSARDDVVEFLVKNHGCSMDLDDANGISTRDMAFNRDLQMHPINSVLKKHAISIEKTKQKAERKQCANCQKQEDPTSKQLFYMCSQCAMVSYCSTECQRADWKKYKKVCKERSVGIKLDRPKALVGSHMWTSPGAGNKRAEPNSYHAPQGVGVDQVFWVNVQYNSDVTNILVYDKTRTCCFYLAPESAGFSEIAAVVKSQQATKGTKSYFKATFDAAGDCSIYPNTYSLKTW